MSDPPPNRTGPVGVGGWLLVVAFTLIVSPIRIFASLVKEFPPLFRDGTWELLTVPGMDSYHWAWAPIIISGVGFNLGLMISAFVLLYLMIEKSAWFPRLYIAWIVAGLAFLIFQSAVLQIVLPDAPFFDDETTREFSQAFVFASIWIPYTLLSRRVRNTFVAKTDPSADATPSPK